MSFVDDVALSLIMTLIIACGALLIDSGPIFYFFIIAAGLVALHLYNRIRRI